MNKVCIYHGVDLDGQCSAAIWKSVCPDGELIPMNYGWKIPWEKLQGKDVTVLDFCLQPWSEMEKLRQVADTLEWIDHHKSAISEWELAGRPFIWGLRDTSYAACELTWKYYYPNCDIPPGVFLLGDYDCWRHSSPDTMAYQMGMRLHDTDPDSPFWRPIFYNDAVTYNKILEQGRIILRYQKQQNKKAAQRLWFPVQFDNKNWMAVNQGGINSTFWDSVWDDTYDGGLSFVYSGKGYWTVSLYSTTVDCSEIAKRHGGGGHPGAAGFQCSELPFDLRCMMSGVYPLTTEEIAEQASIGKPSGGHNNVIFGFCSGSDFNNCLVIGDNLHSKCDGDVVVGYTLFGNKIPKGFKNTVLENPQAFEFLAHSLASVMKYV